MTHISRSIERDYGIHALVVAPDRALKHVFEQKKRLIQACGTHPVYIITPWPRFVREARAAVSWSILLTSQSQIFSKQSSEI